MTKPEAMYLIAGILAGFWLHYGAAVFFGWLRKAKARPRKPVVRLWGDPK